MRTFLKVLVLALAFGAYCALVACSPRPLAYRILPTAVHIVLGAGECSGTIIRARNGRVVVLTARHCVDDQVVKYIEVEGLPARYRRIVRIVKSGDWDLATIEIVGMGYQEFATVADSPIPWGESFELVGLSYEVPWAISRGYVMGEAVAADYPPYKGMDVPLACMGCDEGDSGSGVFNSQGLLSGVLVAISQNNVRAYAVSLHDVRVFLTKALR